MNPSGNSEDFQELESFLSFVAYYSVIQVRAFNLFALDNAMRILLVAEPRHLMALVVSFHVEML